MKILNILFVVLLVSGCSKQEQPEPINNTTPSVTQTINNYLLSVQKIGSTTVIHKIYLNGTEKTTNSFNVQTNDTLTGYSYTIASNGNTIGIIVSLEGEEEYNNVSYKAQNDTLFHSFLIP